MELRLPDLFEAAECPPLRFLDVFLTDLVDDALPLYAASAWCGLDFCDAETRCYEPFEPPPPIYRKLALLRLGTECYCMLGEAWVC